VRANSLIRYFKILFLPCFEGGSSHGGFLVEICSVLAQKGKKQFHVLIIHKLAIEKVATFHACKYNDPLIHL
jgi:hypothetical protein